MTDTNREAFEAECRRYWGECCPDLDLADKGYLSARAAMAYSFWQAATLAERERCAKVCDGFAESSQYQTQRKLAIWCASSIRKGTEGGA